MLLKENDFQLHCVNVDFNENCFDRDKLTTFYFVYC